MTSGKLSTQTLKTVAISTLLALAITGTAQAASSWSYDRSHRSDKSYRGLGHVVTISSKHNSVEHVSYSRDDRETVINTLERLASNNGVKKEHFLPEQSRAPEWFGDPEQGKNWWNDNRYIAQMQFQNGINKGRDFDVLPRPGRFQGDRGVIPIPASVWLMGSALGMLGFARIKRKGVEE